MGRPSKTGGGIGTNGAQIKGKSKYANGGGVDTLPNLPESIFDNAHTNMPPNSPSFVAVNTPTLLRVSCFMSVENQMAELEKTSGVRVVKELEYKVETAKREYRKAEIDATVANFDYEDAPTESNKAKKIDTMNKEADAKVALGRARKRKREAEKGYTTLCNLKCMTSAERKDLENARLELMKETDDYIEKNKDKWFKKTNACAERKDADGAISQLLHVFDRNNYPEHTKYAIANHYMEKINVDDIRGVTSIRDFTKYVSAVNEQKLYKRESDIRENEK
jgi:hypothetical protein